jgi:hypothetical protein
VAAETAARSERPFCAEVSIARSESLNATASRIRHWILVEYRRLWNRDLLAGSGLSEEVKAHLRAQLAALPRSRLLFVKRPEPGRRDAPGVRVFYGQTRPTGGSLFGLELPSYDELRGLDFAGALAGGAPVGERLDRPLVVVCTHGKRDRCCALHGRPLYDALRREEAVRDVVWQSTHVGGDRFAGNLVWLPDGLYFGRVRPADVPEVITELQAGRIPLEHFRGRSAYGFVAQAAERRVREETGLRGIADVRLDGATEVAAGTWSLRFREEPGSATHEVVVEEQIAAEPAFLTCSAAELRRAPSFVATAYRAL